MFKKILCPIDFSDASVNGMEYAATLAQTLGAQLTLINIVKFSMGEGVTLFAYGEMESVKKEKSSHELLNDYCKEVSENYKIICDQIIIPTMEPFEEKIAESENDFDLIVMGSDGVNKLFSFYFGTHSFHVANKVSIPILIVPAECAFKPFNEIIFASDYKTSDASILKQLNYIFKHFNANVKIIHISENNTVLSQQVYRSFTNIMEEELSSIPKLNFQRIIAKDPIQELETIIKETNPNLLVTCLEKHSIFYRLFHANLVKNLCASPEIPLLIAHSQNIDSAS